MELRTVNDMRKLMAEQILKLRAKKTKAADVNAITNGCGKIFTSIKLEMEYNKMLGTTPNIPMLNSGISKKIAKSLPPPKKMVAVK